MRPMLLYVLAAASPALGLTFDGQNNNGHVSGNPSGTSSGWDLPYRYASDFSLGYTQSGSPTVIVPGGAEWDIGLSSPTVAVLMLSGSIAGLPPTLWNGGSLEFHNVLTTTVTAATPFLLEGTVSETGSASLALSLTPVAGGGILGTPTRPDGSLVIAASAGTQFKSISGTLLPGVYAIELGATMLGESAFSSDLTLTLPAPGTLALFGLFGWRRRR